MTDLHIPNSAACMHILKETPGVLRNLLRPATREQLDWRPSMERWSITMVLAHLADVEVGGFRSRFEAMVNHDRPSLSRYDQLALFQPGAAFDPYAEMARFEERRYQTLVLLKELPDGAGERRGRHEEFGEITVSQLLNEFAFHDLGHTRQILELFRAHVFYPEMGPYQSFYKINP
jgi:hypothetical protein